MPNEVPPRTRRLAYWLIVRSGTGQARAFAALTIEDTDGEETLPVFGFQDEALLYLRLGRLGPGWRARETTAGELGALLLHPRAGVKRVALDPLPGFLGRRPAGLESFAREDFVPTIVDGRGSGAAATSPKAWARADGRGPLVAPGSTL